MNNRFKFRVWGKHKGYDVDGNFVLDPDGILGEWDSTITYEEDEYIVEQCTGLSDKNGNLIYENDYIKDKWGNTTYIVKWVDAKFMCVDTEEMMPDTSPRQDWLDKCGFEIIGNIHEQAEQKD